MITTKKEAIIGSEATLSQNPSQPKTVQRFSEERRAQIKKEVSEGRLTRWRGAQTGIERERASIERHGRGGF